MLKQIQGVVHGRSIELDEDLGIPDGQRVSVQVRAAAPSRTWGEGILRSAGIAADVPGFDEAFAQVQRDREQAAFRDIAE